MSHKSRKAADEFREGVDVRLHLALIDHFTILARRALQRGLEVHSPLRGRRELEPPEIQIRIHKGHAIYITAKVFPKFTDQAYGRLAVAAQETQDEDAVGSQVCASR